MLGRLFPRRSQQKDVFGNANELNGILLTQQDLAAKFRQERLRAERSGSPLSMVIIDLPGVRRYLEQENGAPCAGFVRHLGAILKNLTRESDIKGWYQSHDSLPPMKISVLCS